MKHWKPDIYAFVDYREYLKAYYEAGKAGTQVISYRYLARRAGFSSPSFLRHVINGERNLGADSTERLVSALGLTASEASFFRALVAFNQAETVEEKNRAFEAVASCRRFRQAKRIEGGLFAYLSHWYYPAIREMAGRPDFRNDPKWIARRLLPPIKTSEARAALKVLFGLGLLVVDEHDKVSRGEPSLTTEHEVRNLAVGNYHRQMLERAAASIELVKSEQRDLAAMTVCISPSAIPELKRRIHEFREVLLDLCDSDPDPTIVFQFNTQLFPLSDPDA